MNAIDCRALVKSFGATKVLDHLDLAVPDGTIVSVLGESGSGKTTMLRLIAGFDRPDAGTIEFGGEAVDSPLRFVPPNRRRIGFVAQEGNLFPHINVAGNVGFGLSRAERAAGRAEEMLALVGLAELARRYPHELSGGQQQRVALARALAPRPRVVLLDEPFSSLDASLRTSLRLDVMRILRAQRATTLFVTHDQSEALSLADLVGIIDAGRIRQLATPEVLYTQPADASVAGFLGEANILPGAVLGGAVKTALGQLPISGALAAPAGAVSVLLRPEQIRLQPLGSAPAAPQALAGRVLERQYFGHDCLILVGDWGGERPLRVRCLGRFAAEVGEAVAIGVDGEVVVWPSA